ncbi:hypothetical protein ACQ4M3_00530 [Leptolyngbya sp. AN03gr2]|uniref:hypothetical protein n=1 Tax=unclassified Leptolyngbya TaxID=2650499 RepID=UPI003D321A55
MALLNWHRITPVVALLAMFSFHPPAAAEPQVSLEDVRHYLAGISTRSLPNVRSQVDHQALVKTLKQRDSTTAWYIGQWATEDGFVAVYPATKPGKVCLITKSSSTVAYADGKTEGAVIRTSNPLFTDERQQFLRYAASDLFIPVQYRGKSFLVWGLYDPNKARSRFLTLAFQNVPPDLNTFLPSGRTADAIKAQFSAAGCSANVNQPAMIPQANKPSGMIQVIDGITIAVVPKKANQFDIQISNNTTSDFGVFPNRIVAFDRNKRRIPVQFSSLVHGTVVRPGGVLRATIRANRSPMWIQIPEATPQRRMFNFQTPTS